MGTLFKEIRYPHKTISFVDSSSFRAKTSVDNIRDTFKLPFVDMYLIVLDL